MARTRTPTSTHWGTYLAEVEDGRLVNVADYARDGAPAAIGPGIVQAVDDPVRVRRPMIRRGYLDGGHRERRGGDSYVAVPWDEALDMASEALRRVKAKRGNEGIFAGSYGWASAGRFHHTQSQLHRFMRGFGGYVASRDNYSYAAANVIVRRVVDTMKTGLLDHHTHWPAIARHTRLLLCFGGLPIKNAQVTSGGVGRHTLPESLAACQAAGVRMVNVSPLRSDLPVEAGGEWWPIKPGTDAALMLALAHTLIDENLHDTGFLETHAAGFPEFERYVTGTSDRIPRNAEWAAPITGLSADAIRELARSMARERTLINVTWSLQRADHGEQPFWLAITLAAMVGQIGVPGGGFGIGYSSENGIGNPVEVFQWPPLPQGANAVRTFIPVARISDMLLHPGESYQYDGMDLTYPDIDLVYWAGGNPFHHHQDLNRLVRAFRQPETVIVNDIWWTALARHADIVFPITTALERNDISMTHWEQTVTPMRRALDPVGESRNDHDVFRALAARLGFEDEFTEGRDEMGWLQELWGRARDKATRTGFELPTFEDFWPGDPIEVLAPAKDTILLEGYREDPVRHPVHTPSGRIEIFSEAIADLGLEDCPGHPAWLEPFEWLGSEKAQQFPLHLISNQPRTRLHSQLDSGAVSRASKIQGREPLTMHPTDAVERGLLAGDVVRVFNDRGACLAGVVLSDDIRPGVVQLATGAWYDPLEPGVIGSLCKHGNPNVLTRDKGSSALGQGPSAQTALVQVERYVGALPPVTAFEPPPIEER